MDELMVELMKPSSVESLKPKLDTFVHAFDKELWKRRKKLYNDYIDKDPGARVNKGFGKLLIVSEIETIDIVRSSLVDAWKSVGGTTRDTNLND
jgi:hypothetical protein